MGVHSRVGAWVFLFQFYHKLDLQRIYQKGPWFFYNHMLILNQVKMGDILAQVPLFHVHFWVQVHDLPVGFMSLAVRQQLGNWLRDLLSMMIIIMLDYGELSCE